MTYLSNYTPISMYSILNYYTSLFLTLPCLHIIFPKFAYIFCLKYNLDHILQLDSTIVECWVMFFSIFSTFRHIVKKWLNAILTN